MRVDNCMMFFTSEQLSASKPSSTTHNGSEHKRGCLLPQFGLFSVLYFALRIASVRILGAGRMLESKAVIMIDAKMIETQMVADARCAKTCWGLQPAPPPARA